MQELKTYQAPFESVANLKIRMYIESMQLSTSDLILEYLSSINDFVSGTELAKIVHCTPQNVSYHIRRLRSFGVDIEVSHRGYRFDRSCDTRLTNLAKKFREMGVVLEYIKSCLKLVSLFPRNNQNQQKVLYYTFNEADFFSNEGKGNLSFAIGGIPDIPLSDWIMSFLNAYLDSQLSQVKRDDTVFLLYRDYVVSRICHISDILSVQIAVNSCRTRVIEGMKIKSLFEITGDFTGLKGFSILIFENLYANLDGCLPGQVK